MFLILAHERRRVVHFNVTEHPTAQWTAQQVVEAFPWDEAPRISCAIEIVSTGLLSATRAAHGDEGGRDCAR